MFYNSKEKLYTQDVFKKTCKEVKNILSLDVLKLLSKYLFIFKFTAKFVEQTI